jgi:hypothetical protein
LFVLFIISIPFFYIILCEKNTKIDTHITSSIFESNSSSSLISLEERDKKRMKILVEHASPDDECGKCSEHTKQEKEHVIDNSED